MKWIDSFKAFFGITPSGEVCRGEMPHEFEASHEGEVVSVSYRGHRHLNDWGWELATRFAKIAADGIVFDGMKAKKLSSFLRSPERPEVDALLEVMCLKLRNPVLFRPTNRVFEISSYRALYRAASKTLRGLSNEDALLVLGWAIYLGSEVNERLRVSHIAKMKIEERRRSNR